MDDIESDRTERKRAFKGDGSKKARQAVCAFANEQEERILDGKRRFKNLPFDIYPIPTAKLSDLSRLIFESEYLPAAFAPDILEINSRSYTEQLASYKMIVSPSETTPTVLGLLALGKNPQDFFPGASIQFLRIDGTELSDPVIDEENIGGAIVEMIRWAEEKLAAHNRAAVDVVPGPTHLKSAIYSPPALQQILHNAVLHRTYESTNAPVRIYWFNDRIEIYNPGGPFGNVTEENLVHPGITAYRNPNIGDIVAPVLQNIATNYVVIPLGADLFSLQGLKNLGPTLRSWKHLWQPRQCSAGC